MCAETDLRYLIVVQGKVAIRNKYKLDILFRIYYDAMFSQREIPWISLCGELKDGDKNDGEESCEGERLMSNIPYKENTVLGLDPQQFEIK